MIGRNIPLVITTASRIIRRRPSYAYLRDDATSAGIVGLCRAVQHVVNGKSVSNVSAFLTHWIRYEIEQFLQKELIPTDTEDAEIPVSSIEVACEPDEMALVDLRDLLFSCCETEAEKNVIKMRLIGMDRRDIAKKLGVSPPCITRILRLLEQRYELARQSTL
jgi:RNA polymerase sigma factor (sigma-70 family)